MLLKAAQSNITAWLLTCARHVSISIQWGLFDRGEYGLAMQHVWRKVNQFHPPIVHIIMSLVDWLSRYLLFVVTTIRVRTRMGTQHFVWVLICSPGIYTLSKGQQIQNRGLCKVLSGEAPPADWKCSTTHNLKLKYKHKCQSRLSKIFAQSTVRLTQISLYFRKCYKTIITELEMWG